MTEKQIKKYEELASLKRQLESFIEMDGYVAMREYSLDYGETCATLRDDAFTEKVKQLAREKLKEVEQEIADL